MSLFGNNHIFMFFPCNVRADNLVRRRSVAARQLHHRHAIPLSGEEDRHQDHHNGGHRNADLRQRHEHTIRLLVTHVIVATCCGVFKLTVVRHPS